jgi:RNase H-fold protein (predicted Holliday junction resolvase)
MWLERENCEYDLQGKPEMRKKEKLIEIIIGESYTMEYQEYPKEELKKEFLEQLPKENLQMIEYSLKNAKTGRRRSNNMLHK